MSFEDCYQEFEKELNAIKNNEESTEDDKNNQVINLIKKIAEVNHQMQLKITTIDIFKKQMTKNLQRIDNEISYEQNETKQAKADTKSLVQQIQEMKKLKEKMDNEQSKQNNEIESKFKELKAKIDSKIEFNPKDVEKYEKENEIMQNEINKKIEEFEAYKKDHIEKLRKLEIEYQTFNSQNEGKFNELNEKYENIKQIQQKKQKLEKYNNAMVQEIQTIMQKVSPYEQLVNMKKDSYVNYQKDLKSLTDTSFKIHQRQKELNEANKNAGIIILDLIKENEELDNELKQEEQKTEEIKKLCKEKQEIIKNIN